MSARNSHRQHRPDRDPPDIGAPWLPHEPTALHQQRLDAVCAALRGCGATSVADLGCGDGALVHRLLADHMIQHIVAIDSQLAALGRLERGLAPQLLASGRLTLVHGSFTHAHAALQAVDAVVLLETIEHIPLERLSGVEHHVFGLLRPDTVVLTTPNQEYNALFGMVPGQMREPGHCFEWPRHRLRAWAAGLAQRRGYTLTLSGIGPQDPCCGCPTQMALFCRIPGERR